MAHFAESLAGEDVAVHLFAFVVPPGEGPGFGGDVALGFAGVAFGASGATPGGAFGLWFGDEDDLVVGVPGFEPGEGFEVLFGFFSELADGEFVCHGSLVDAMGARP